MHWEDPEPLTTAFKNKIAKYSNSEILNALSKKNGAKNYYVLPLVIGARGGWCLANNILVKQLNIAKSDIDSPYNPKR